MAEIINLNNQSQLDNFSIVLDTNILIYIDSVINTDTRYNYDKIFENLLESNGKISLTDNVISEFIHRYCKLAYKDYIESQKLDSSNFQYKRDFQQTQTFNMYFEIALTSIQEFLDSGIELLCIEEEHVKKALIDTRMKDFNDNLLLNIAESQNMGILTHDRDFLNITTEISVYRSGK